MVVVNWIFGRGLSIECNLTWSVPTFLNSRSRICIKIIKCILKKKMVSPNVDTSIIKKFLNILAVKTKINHRHRFITTNWDNLLQREIDSRDFHSLPKWLASSWVYHLNGTVDCEKNSNRSPFLLEIDDASQRKASLEANQLLNKIIWDKLFVVVGVSFDCQIDQDFLEQLNKLEDNLPIGNSTWIIVNPCFDSLEKSADKIQKAIPQSKVIKVQQLFSSWVINDNMQALINLNVL